MIYLTECRICHVRLENQKQNLISYQIFVVMTRQNAPQADQHFKLPVHNFNQHAIFTLIDQLDNVNIDKELATLQLRKREEFWIQKLKTLHPYGLKLDFPNQQLKILISAFLVHVQ